MALVPSTQWALDRTADGALNVAWGLVRAITSDNVQLLPILACQKFGATLAISDETREHVQTRVLRPPDHRVTGYLKTLVGFNPHDAASQIGETDAGIRFLGLASALASSIELYDAGAAIGKMLHATNPSVNQIPPDSHIRDLLAALQPRCSLSGFGDVVTGYQVILGEALAALNYHLFEYDISTAPSSDAIKDIVNEFRNIGRIGDPDTSHLEIKVCKCASWVTAFTKWCLENPSIVLETQNGKRESILRVEGSRVTIIIPIIAGAWGSGVEITQIHGINSPEALICPLGNRQDAWKCMVNMNTYGKWLFREFGFDRSEKRVVQTYIPHFIHSTLASLTFWPGEFIDMDESLVHLSPTLFPSQTAIGDVCALILDVDNIPKIERAPDLGSLHFADSPVGRPHLRTLRSSCRCLKCKPGSSNDTAMNINKCKEEIFFLGIAKIVADILILSLFEDPRELLVETSPVRLLQTQENFLTHVLAVVMTGHQTECDVKNVLTYARALLGHNQMVKSLGDSYFDWDWLLTCHKGQAFYPAIFDDKEGYYVRKEGFLRLSWHRGQLQYKGNEWTGEIWKGILGCTTTWGEGQPLTVSPEDVRSPNNLFHHLKVEWEVSKRENFIMEAKIVIKDGKRKSVTTRNPIDTLMGFPYGMIAVRCGHSPQDILAEPDRSCVYIGPEAAPSYRHPHHTVIVPVDGADHLRFFCIPGREENRTFVLRQEACLRCTLDVCRIGRASFVIL